MSHPSFSIVLETENLETSDIKGLQKSIASLADQNIEKANEVLLINSGNTPPNLLLQLRSSYPWLTIKTAPPETEYYKSKMLGLEWTTGDIIVYYDSDCIYDRNWLTAILKHFDNPDIHVVGGETTTDGVGFYGTAMALCYIFPQYSGLKNLVPVKQYFLNNVAFRRSLLETIPIPTNLPLYRGNCVIHAKMLLAAGYTIWRQPEARSLHAPPNGWEHYFQRFLLIGHDWYWQERLIGKRAEDGNLEKSDDPTMTRQSKLAVGIDRISKMIQRDRRHAFYLPFCLPIVVFSVLLIAIGYQITTRRPHYLRDRIG
jgi:glycosyltransferase involved in cell wall biosynthesis